MNKIIQNYFLLFAIALLFANCKENKQKEKAGEKRDTITTAANAMQVIGLATVEPKSRIVSLYAETGGIVKRIDHDINDNVKAGEAIVELTSELEEAQLAQARSKLATQHAAIATSRAQLASQKVKLENAKVNLDRNNKLLVSGGATQQALTDSKFSFESLQADMQGAASGIQQQEDRLKELQADINYYQELLNRKKVKAPVNGKVLSMEVKIGNNISTSQSVCDFAPEGPLMAITEIDELFATDVKVGMNAYIRPQGKLDTIGKGKVLLTSPYLRKKSLFADNASNMEDRRVREVRVLLDTVTDVLLGSRVECVIDIKK
jgi:HlyD family secretion protein